MNVKASNLTFAERRFYAQLDEEIQAKLAVFGILETYANPCKVTFDHEAKEINIHCPNRRMVTDFEKVKGDFSRSTRFAFGKDNPYRFQVIATGDNYRPGVWGSKRDNPFEEFYVENPIINAMSKDLSILFSGHKPACWFQFDFDKKVARVQCRTAETSEYLRSNSVDLVSACTYQFGGRGWSLWVCHDEYCYRVHTYSTKDESYPRLHRSASWKELCELSRITLSGKKKQTAEIRLFCTLGNSSNHEIAGSLRHLILENYEEVVAETGYTNFRIYYKKNKHFEAIDQKYVESWRAKEEERRKNYKRGRRTNPNS